MVKEIRLSRTAQAVKDFEKVNMEKLKREWNKMDVDYILRERRM